MEELLPQPSMWVHPILQTLALVLSAYVLYLGWLRFEAAHLGRKGILFPWKRHVLQGSVAMIVWASGFLIGLGMAWWNWKAVLVTGLHHRTALAMAPLLVFGYLSGLIMDKVKKRRTVLPLLHGLNNTLLVLLALAQFVTGIQVLRDFIIP